jgi:hypothetical protein
MADLSEIVVDPQRALERLVSEPLGAALWRAAIAEERSAVLEARITELERQAEQEKARRHQESRFDQTDFRSGLDELTAEDLYPARNGQG